MKIILYILLLKFKEFKLHGKFIKYFVFHKVFDEF